MNMMRRYVTRTETSQYIGKPSNILQLYKRHELYPSNQLRNKILTKAPIIMCRHGHVYVTRTETSQYIGKPSNILQLYKRHELYPSNQLRNKILTKAPIIMCRHGHVYRVSVSIWNICALCARLIFCPH